MQGPQLQVACSLHDRHWQERNANRAQGGPSLLVHPRRFSHAQNPFPLQRSNNVGRMAHKLSFNGKPIPPDPPMTVSNTGLETYPTGDWTSPVIIHVVISKIVGTLKTHQHKMSKAFNFFMSVGFSCPRRAEKGHEGPFKPFNPQDPQTHSPYISFEKS